MPTKPLFFLIWLAAASVVAAQPTLTRIDPQAATGTSLAVIVDDVPLVHTVQLLPTDSAGNVLHAGDAAAQCKLLLDRLGQVLSAAGSSLDQLVRLHICVKDQAAADLVQQQLARQFSSEHRPAMTLVESDLAVAEALVGIDAVAAAPQSDSREVKHLREAAVLPSGPRVFISGQAEPGDLATATRGTLQSLGKTLAFLGLNKSHAVQLKAFVTPVDHAVVMSEVQRFFGEMPAPPLVLVQWKSNLPIEIELVAASPRKDPNLAGPTIEFLTPPEMKASPVFCRVTRIDSPKSIYTSGLIGRATTSGEAQVRDIFGALDRLTKQTGSDLKHLAKATYYVSDNDASAQLNQLRPEFYDPKRPPAASKAMVRGIGFPQRGIAIDMIAVPAADPLAPWRKDAAVRPVSPDRRRHTMHTYFNTCPESPDGKLVLFFASSTPEGHLGDVCIRDRATGAERVLARDVHVEDAHRVACQQWLSQGRRVVFHGERDGQWYVASVDLETGQQRIVAQDRLAGWGQPHADLVPLYGPHWNPGSHRDLELADLESGEIRTVVKVDEIAADWLTKAIGDRPRSIFFPVLSPDLSRVFFKMATPAGGDARSKQASTRLGLFCYDLDQRRLLYDNPRWGHPSWHPDSRTIVETSYHLFNSSTGQSRQLSNLPSPRGDHPSASPDGRLIVTDTTMDIFGGDKREWAIIVADARGEDYVVLHKFDNSRGASSWRRSHPHPVFSPDGQRIYFNTSSGDWTQLVVAAAGESG